MTNSDDRDRELAELRAKVEQLSAGQRSVPPRVEVTGGPSPGGGFRGGFFGCFGVIAAIFAFIILVVAMGQCSKSVATNTPGSTTAPTASGGSQASSGWIYSEEGSALQDAKTKLACTHSSDQVHLTFPYHDTGGELCIRRSPRRGLDAYVALDGNGQVLCGIESCSVHVRFDKQPVKSFPAVGAADHSTNILFLNRTAALVAALKKSSQTVIELRLYEAGDQTLTFDTSALKWP
jgi:hypothetical protein